MSAEEQVNVNIYYFDIEKIKFIHNLTKVQQEILKTIDLDFCQEKKEIALKMRTADICDQCLSYSEKNDSNRVYMNQLMQIMDGVRSNLMFRNRSKYLLTNSRLEFRGMMHKMYLTDLGDLQINLNPTERALYLVFIKKFYTICKVFGLTWIVIRY